MGKKVRHFSLSKSTLAQIDRSGVAVTVEEKEKRAENKRKNVDNNDVDNGGRGNGEPTGPGEKAEAANFPHSSDSDSSVSQSVSQSVRPTK